MAKRDLAGEQLAQGVRRCSGLAAEVCGRCQELDECTDWKLERWRGCMLM
jgi:hypothetical protein